MVLSCRASWIQVHESLPVGGAITNLVESIALVWSLLKHPVWNQEKSFKTQRMVIFPLIWINENTF